MKVRLFTCISSPGVVNRPLKGVQSAQFHRHKIDEHRPTLQNRKFSGQGPNELTEGRSTLSFKGVCRLPKRTCVISRPDWHVAASSRLQALRRGLPPRVVKAANISRPSNRLTNLSYTDRKMWDSHFNDAFQSRTRAPPFNAAKQLIAQQAHSLKWSDGILPPCAASAFNN
jgi:hypothetical protein